MFQQAKNFRDEHTHFVNDYNEFKKIIKEGGFVRCGWDGNQETEKKVKEETKATIRCIPFDENIKNLTCIFSGKSAKHEVIYAKAY
jgi:prolyl-tRNA synthetase